MHPVILAPLASFIFGAEATGPAPFGSVVQESGPSAFDIVFPLTMLLLIALTIPTLLLTANYFLSRWALGTRNSNPARNEPYESGLATTVGNVGERFDVKFYLIAMLFLAFDIEVAFLYPWAIRFKHGGWEMVGLLVVFLVLLEVGYLYLYKKGALDWDR
jgi:NADH-quinone oxidoreductase subunit A